MTGCCLLSTAGILASNRYAVHSQLSVLAACFACVVVGYLSMLWTASTLRNNIQNERWPVETLAPFRQVIDHVLWRFAMAVLLVAMLATLIFQDRHHHSWYWATFFLLQAQTQFTYAFGRPREPSATGHLLDWSKVSPLRSDHWGER